MSPNAQRIAIAQECGWELSPINASWPNPYWTDPTTKALCVFAELPNYLNDLNAMHEAEQIFDKEPVDTKSMYWDYLALAAMPESFPGDDTFLRDYVMIRATAAQRAEAFLRALGVWKDDV